MDSSGALIAVLDHGFFNSSLNMLLFCSRFGLFPSFKNGNVDCVYRMSFL